MMRRVEKVRGDALVTGDCMIEGNVTVKSDMNGPTIDELRDEIVRLRERIEVLELGNTVDTE